MIVNRFKYKLVLYCIYLKYSVHYTAILPDRVISVKQARSSGKDWGKHWMLNSEQIDE